MTARFRRGEDRGGGRGDGRNALVCPSCGLRNDSSARFCRNCGLPLGWPQDPVRGTTTRRADLPSERGAGVASIIGLLAAVGVLVVAGFLVLRGSGGGSLSPTHTPSPRPSLAQGSPGPSASGFAPTTGVATPPASAEITDTPTQPVTEPPGSFPATLKGFTCDLATIGDPTQGRWKVTHVNWMRGSTYDTVILDLNRLGDATRSSTISIETVTLDEVSARFGMNAPQNAEVAVVVTFARPFTGFGLAPATTHMKVAPNLAMDQGTDGLWHVVIGAVGQGCHRIGVPTWNSDPTATLVQLMIDVKK